jgi:hypothetical protein
VGLRAVRIAGFAVVGLVLAGVPASAQQSVRDVLDFLLTNQSVPTGDFVKDTDAARATSDTINRLLLLELTNVPAASPAPAFTYRFNPAIGVPERATANFGAFFTDRVLTAGTGQASIGVQYRQTSFTRLDGRDLQDGRFVTTGNQFRDEPAPFDIETLTLDLDSRTLTVIGNVGVGPRLDLGVVVPFIALSMKGERVNDYRGQRIVQATAEAEVSGVGDLGLRVKYALVERGGSGLGVAADLRLPTGNAEDLLGTGETSLRITGIASAQRGLFAIDANGGVAFGGLTTETTYRASFSVSPADRLTVVGEILGRRIAEGAQLELVRAAHPLFAGVDTFRLLPQQAGTTTASALTGFKWNLAGTWILNGHIAFPLTDSGLRSGTMTILGLDYAFGR